MELQFNKKTVPCLRNVLNQMQTQELTQDVKLPDAMPDVGRVLGTWGQVLIRSKEWRSGEIHISGGVMAWVMYAPEDGSDARSMETWIPFQMKWELPDTQRDGAISVDPRIKSMDCRSTSARKLLLRCNISLLADAWEPVEEEIPEPVTMPEDIQLLKETYPMTLPIEAGEKQFQMDEELTVSGSYPGVERIIRYSLTPELVEQKVLAGRLVFRGAANLHMLYSSEDAKLHSWESQIPFSQYVDLDRDYGPNAFAQIHIIPTGIELEKGEEGRIRLKVSMIAQYVVFDRMTMELITDAYSPRRSTAPILRQMNLPSVLDNPRQSLTMEQSVRSDGDEIVDMNWTGEHPVKRQMGDSAQMEMNGQFQVLYYDKSGDLQCGTARNEEKWQLPSNNVNSIHAYLHPEIQIQGNGDGDNIRMSAEANVDSMVFSNTGMPVLVGLEMGEIVEPDPERPSLVLRRAGQKRLWDLAKECGSTVDAIKTANGLQQEPGSNQMLLIPVS